MLDKQSVDELLLIDDRTHIDYVPLYHNGVARGSRCAGIDEPVRKKKKPAKRNSHTEAIGPRIPYEQFSGLWFLHGGKPYAVRTAPVAILKKAVQGMIHNERAQVLLRQEYLDIIERWYIVCEAKRLKLYKSKQEAEREM